MTGIVGARKHIVLNHVRRQVLEKQGFFFLVDVEPET
jgi:hypothetical protein